MKRIEKWLEYYIPLFEWDLIHVLTGLLHFGYFYPINHCKTLSSIMSRKFIISLFKRAGFVTKASCPDISPLLTHPPAGCWSTGLAWLQISWVTELFRGQECEESACFGRWLELSSQTDWDPALPGDRRECYLKSDLCRSLTVQHGSWVYFLIPGNSGFLFFLL